MADAEHVRWHEDWWSQCRTCRHWEGDRGASWAEGKCAHASGPMSGLCTWQGGYCDKWDTFDMEAAEVVMRINERRQRTS